MVYFRRAFLANKSLETKRLVGDLFKRNAAAFAIRSAPALEPWAATQGAFLRFDLGESIKAGVLEGGKGAIAQRFVCAVAYTRQRSGRSEERSVGKVNKSK